MEDAGRTISLSHPDQAEQGENIAHSTQKHSDGETNDTTARPQQGTTETAITSAPEKRTKNTHFSPAKAMAVSIPHRHKRAKAMAVSNPHRHKRAKAMAVSSPHTHQRAKAIAVSDHRATSPATPRRSARGRRRDPISTYSHAIPPQHKPTQAQKPQNINDQISKPEILSGELHAKLMIDSQN